MKIGVIGGGGLAGQALGASTLSSLLIEAEIHVLVKPEEHRISMSNILNSVALAWGLMDPRFLQIRYLDTNLSFQNYTHIIVCHPDMPPEFNSIDFDGEIIENWQPK